jgi:hypothetical protein
MSLGIIEQVVNQSSAIRPINYTKKKIVSFFFWGKRTKGLQFFISPPFFLWIKSYRWVKAPHRLSILFETLFNTSIIATSLNAICKERTAGFQSLFFSAKRADGRTEPSADLGSIVIHIQSLFFPYFFFLKKAPSDPVTLFGGDMLWTATLTLQIFYWNWGGLRGVRPWNP